MKKIKIHLNTIRLWLIKKLFIPNEKYLIIRAIEDRLDNLERIKLREPWADKHSITIDCMDYLKLKEIFSTSDWM